MESVRPVVAMTDALGQKNCASVALSSAWGLLGVLPVCHSMTCTDCRKHFVLVGEQVGYKHPHTVGQRIGTVVSANHMQLQASLSTSECAPRLPKKPAQVLSTEEGSF